MTVNEEYDIASNQEAMKILASLMIKEKIKIEKQGFVPYEKGDYIYTAVIHELQNHVIIDVRREEVVGTWNTRQTRFFFLGELTTIGSDGGEYRTPIRDAYHNLMDLMNSLVHMVPRHILQYIYISIKQNPVFEKIGTFRLCFEFDPRTGETPMKEEASK